MESTFETLISIVDLDLTIRNIQLKVFRHLSLFETIIYRSVRITFIRSDIFDANDYRVKKKDTNSFIKLQKHFIPAESYLSMIFHNSTFALRSTIDLFHRSEISSIKFPS